MSENNPVKISNEVSWGNIVSWAVIIIGLVVVFTELKVEANVAKDMAKEALVKGSITQADITELKIEAARNSEYAKATNAKLDLLISIAQSRQQAGR